MKANFVIFIAVLLLACVIARVATLWHYVILGALAVLSWVCLEFALQCYVAPPVKAPPLKPPVSTTPAARSVPSRIERGPVQETRPIPATPPDHAPPSSSSVSPLPEVPLGPPPGRPDLRHGGEHLAARIAAGFLRAGIFRMASSFPYYVETFADPQERCGIDSNSMPFIPKETCFPATKIFPLMYPDIHYVQGFAPASAHIFAYGELGLRYALFVLAAGGLVLGFVWRAARYRSSPLFWSVATGACVFAYCLSQVSLTGALTYGNGLFWYGFPAAAALGAVAFGRWLPRAIASLKGSAKPPVSLR